AEGLPHDDEGGAGGADGGGSLVVRRVGIGEELRTHLREGRRGERGEGEDGGAARTHKASVSKSKICQRLPKSTRKIASPLAERLLRELNSREESCTGMNAKDRASRSERGELPPSPREREDEEEDRRGEHPRGRPARDGLGRDAQEIEHR